MRCNFCAFSCRLKIGLCLNISFVCYTRHRRWRRTTKWPQTPSRPSSRPIWYVPSDFRPKFFTRQRQQWRKWSASWSPKDRRSSLYLKSCQPTFVLISLSRSDDVRRLRERWMRAYRIRWPTRCSHLSIVRRRPRLIRQIPLTLLLLNSTLISAHCPSRPRRRNLLNNLISRMDKVSWCHDLEFFLNAIQLPNNPFSRENVLSKTWNAKRKLLEFRVSCKIISRYLLDWGIVSLCYLTGCVSSSS